MSAERTAAFLVAAVVAAAIAIIVTPRDRARSPLVWLALWAVLFTIPPLVTAWRA